MRDSNKTEIKLQGLKKAVGIFNSWQGAARIYFDKSDLTVWTKAYVGPQEWSDYHSDTITEVYNKATVHMEERNNKIKMEELKDLCREALNG